jgi:hypothetical protein
MGITLSTAARNAACDAIVGLINGGSGPGTLQIQKSDDTVIATLTFSDPAFGAASSGVATANSITQDSNTSAGTAAKFRIRDSNGTLLINGTVSTGAADINFNSVTFTAGGVAAITLLTATMPAS